VADEEQMTSKYAERVGLRLRQVRKQQRLSLQAVEAASQQEFKASVLGAYERGERAISVPRLQRLARFYNVPVDQLLPIDPDAEPAWSDRSEDGSVIDVRNGAATARDEKEEKVTIDLTKLDQLAPVERELLGRYVGMVQLQRQDFNGRMLTIRREDLRILASVLQTTPDGLRHRLDEAGVRL
jgi:transcriptional regulator with XRE-family HTH domain